MPAPAQMTQLATRNSASGPYESLGCRRERRLPPRNRYPDVEADGAGIGFGVVDRAAAKTSKLRFAFSTMSRDTVWHPWAYASTKASKQILLIFLGTPWLLSATNAKCLRLEQRFASAMARHLQPVSDITGCFLRR